MINLQDIVKNIKKLQNFQGEILLSEPMKKHTTFKIGGDAQAFATPLNEESLLLLLAELTKNNIPFFILGGGSNIVVSDSGIEGFVITTEKLKNISAVQQNESYILSCSAGCTIEEVTQFCIDNALTGLENFAGLPGTVGGALFMNARCYDASISDSIKHVRFSTEQDFNTIQTYSMNASDWDYKKSPFQGSNPTSLILSADFIVSKGNKENIENKCATYIQDRKKKGHFDFPSAGSVFKNNRQFGKSSGEIIDSVGFKGFRVGNAQISSWHGNFIINLGDASADDIKRIVSHVQEKVSETVGFNLESEILFIGKFT